MMLRAFENGWLETAIEQDNQALRLAWKSNSTQVTLFKSSKHLLSLIELNLWKWSKVNTGSSKGKACFSGCVTGFRLFQLWLMLLAFLTSWSKHFSRNPLQFFLHMGKMWVRCNVFRGWLLQPWWAMSLLSLNYVKKENTAREQLHNSPESNYCQPWQNARLLICK